MRTAIVGSGYVGLVTSACLAELGHEVFCIDKDQQKIKRLRAGVVSIFEPGLEKMITQNAKLGRLKFESSIENLEDIEVYFIAVGTPSLPNGRGADLSNVFEVAEKIALSAIHQAIVVIKSTVPVGTGDKLESIARSVKPGLDISFVSNPEFLSEGNAIKDFMSPDRIVIGSESDRARQIVGDLYRPLTSNGSTILFTGRRAAELIKYSANAFLATKISFINEIADLCEAAGADIKEVSEGIGMDKRIGRAFLEAGPGYGGSCFPKDSAALLATAQSYAVNLRLVESTIAANEARKRDMARRIVGAVGGNVQNKTISLLGLTFKANTDDMRESPSISLVSALQFAGAKVRVYDPQGMKLAQQFLNNVVYTKSAYECVEGADCIVLVTEWDEFRHLKIDRLFNLVRTPIFVDLRNVMDPKELAAHGFVAYSIGRTVENIARVINSVSTKKSSNQKTKTLTRKSDQHPLNKIRQPLTLTEIAPLLVTDVVK